MGRLRAGQSFPVREESPRKFLVPVRKKATTALASAGVRKKSKGSCSSDAAMPPPPSTVRPESAAAAVGDVTVEDTDALACGVCFLPLKPPIFQVRARTTFPCVCVE
ncbi:unnamed protein product [Urochloa decumbens]|uniref:Uncharacterized protein n=1 Tax=Urochloa decumbens TaxID=240449 RepID=A0ABC8W5L0_9POAL